MPTKKRSKQHRKETRAKPVLVNFILDRSGSMESVRDETISGVNRYIEELKRDGSSYLFSLTQFNTNFDIIHAAVLLDEVKPLNRDNYRPDGFTALLDAVGSTVGRVEKEAQDVEKVLVVVMTDGHENSSHRWTTDRLRELIQRKEKEGNWTFVFLGATADAWDTGVALGVQAGNAYRYDPGQTAQVTACLAASTSAYARSIQRQATCFVDPRKGKTGGIFSR